MKLPEWRPLPPHIKTDDSDSSGFAAVLLLVAPVVVIVVSVLALIFGLLA